MILIIVALNLCIGLLSGQTDQPCRFASSSTVTIGLRNYICARIKSANTTYSYAYPVTVDKFTALSLKNFNRNITNSSWNANQPISLELQFQNSGRSLEILLSNNTVYRNLISVVIQVNRGTFQDIINDSQDCTTCNSIANICHQNQCFKNGDFLMQNKLLIYVSWLGTDVNDEHMVSHTQRLKKLSKFSLSNIFVQATNMA